MIPTNDGEKTVEQVVDQLMYDSYAANRDAGMTQSGYQNLIPSASVEAFERKYQGERAR